MFVPILTNPTDKQQRYITEFIFKYISSSTKEKVIPAGRQRQADVSLRPAWSTEFQNLQGYTRNLTIPPKE